MKPRAVRIEAVPFRAPPRLAPVAAQGRVGLALRIALLVLAVG